MIDYVIEGGVDYIVALAPAGSLPPYMPERAVIAFSSTNPDRRARHPMGCGGEVTPSGCLSQLREIRPARRRRHLLIALLLQQTFAGGAALLPTFPHRLGPSPLPVILYNIREKPLRSRAST